MKNILITGGLGYIGGRLTKYLSEKRDIKTVITTRRNHNLSRVKSKLNNTKIIATDYKSKEKIISMMNGADAIIHLIGPDAHSRMRNKINNRYVDIIENLSDAANKTGIKKIIYFSTIHVYGNNLEGSVDERTAPIPNKLFSSTHLLVENLLVNLAYNYRVSVVRCANVFGIPYFDNSKCWELVINDFCKSAIKNKKIIIKSSGLEYKNFIAMEDVIAGTYFILQDKMGNQINTIYNLGGAKVIRIIEIAEKIKIILKNSFNINCTVKIDNSLGDKINHVPFEYSIDKIKKLGFNPISLEKEIYRTLDYCMKNGK